MGKYDLFLIKSKLWVLGICLPTDLEVGQVWDRSWRVHIGGVKKWQKVGALDGSTHLEMSLSLGTSVLPKGKQRG